MDYGSNQLAFGVTCHIQLEGANGTFQLNGCRMTTAAQRKAAQRQRDKLMGWREVTVRVAQEQADALREFAASLPDPKPLTDPDQLDMLAQLDAAISGGDMSSFEMQSNDQGNLF